MFTYTLIIAALIAIQLGFSLRSYIKTGVNEFLFIFFSEAIQLILFYLIAKSIYCGQVNISYKNTVFFFNLTAVYFYFKACSSINSKDVIFNKAIVKSSALCGLSCFFYFFIAWFEIMFVGIKDISMQAFCTTELFCSFFPEFATVELKYLYVYVAFQVLALGLSITLTSIYSTKKVRDTIALLGQMLAILLELIILSAIDATWAIPYLYVIVTLACVISNQIAYCRENYHIMMLTKYLWMYKHQKVSESALNMTLTSYLVSSNKSKSAQYIFYLLGEKELYNKLKSRTNEF